MMIELNRFLTEKQIDRLYHIPPDLRPAVMAQVPVVHRKKNGVPIFVESNVDRAVDACAATATGRPPPPSNLGSKGKGGRKKTTTDIGLFIKELKDQGKVWKEIFRACKSRFPGRVESLEQVRTIWRRHYRGKK